MSGKTTIVGWVLSVLGCLLLVFSAVMKLMGGPQLDQGMGHLGLPHSMVLPLAILELTCTAIYLVPPTAVVGAILLTGYLGGAMCTHWRVGDPFIVQVILILVLWLGLYLREPRLKALIPVRTA